MEQKDKQIIKSLIKPFNAGLQIMNTDPKFNEIGYLARFLSMISLPYKDPHTTEYERINGQLNVLITTPEKFGGVPYGKYPRILKIFIENEAFLKKNREIKLGNSLREFCNRLGIEIGGKQVQLLKKAFISFSNTTFRISFPFFENPRKQGDYKTGFLPIEESLTFWDKKNPEQISLFDGYIILSDQYFQQIIEHPMPIDLRAIRSLQDSSLALDIYIWLTGRFFSLKKESLISWDNLANQFGSDYKELRKFKDNYIKELKKVLFVYPEARVKGNKEGLLLTPSKTSIRKSLR